MKNAIEFMKYLEKKRPEEWPSNLNLRLKGYALHFKTIMGQ